MMCESSTAAINVPTAEGTPMTLAFNNLRVEIDGEKILDNVSGSVKPGKVLAIMGPSGKHRYFDISQGVQIYI